MPRFFEEHTLTDGQRQRWDAAIAAYHEVMRRNCALKLGHDPSNEELDAFLFNIIESGAQPGHPKSSLFARLLEGKAPLAYPPPCYYSYPWYSLFDDPSPARELSVQLGAGVTTLGGCTGVPKGARVVTIGQTYWQVFEELAPDRYVVGFGAWSQAGWRWELRLDAIPAAIARGRILAPHDDTLERVTTVQQLLDLARFSVNQRVRDLSIVAAGGELQREPSTTLPEVFAKAYVKQATDSAQRTITQRVSEGLPPVPDAREIEALIEAECQSHLQPRSDLPYWVARDDGLLYVVQWELRRLSGEISQ